MNKTSNKIRCRRAVTLLELVIAMAMLTIIFAVVVPQFAVIRGSWDIKQRSAEILQNARVLMDHINRNLTKASQLTAASSSQIDFNDSNGLTWRYGVSGDYVQFGQPSGSMADLAGPVSSLAFTCYDANVTLLSPVTDAQAVRLVKAEATVTNNGQAKTFTTWAYLRTNSVGGTGESWQTTYDYVTGIQDTNVFAYKGDSAGGNMPSNPSEPDDSTVFNSSEYDKIEVDDGSFQMYASTASARYALMRFKILISENASTVSSIDVTWNGKGINAKSSSTDGATLYIWNYTSSSYEQLQQSADTEAEVTLTGTISSSVTNYIGGAGQNTITILVSTTSKKSGSSACEIYTDYVRVIVSAQTGGVYP